MVHEVLRTIDKLVSLLFVGSLLDLLAVLEAFLLDLVHVGVRLVHTVLQLILGVN